MHGSVGSGVSQTGNDQVHVTTGRLQLSLTMGQCGVTVTVTLPSGDAHRGHDHDVQHAPAGSTRGVSRKCENVTAKAGGFHFWMRGRPSGWWRAVGCRCAWGIGLQTGPGRILDRRARRRPQGSPWGCRGNYNYSTSKLRK
jgi:hypothetical protein